MFDLSVIIVNWNTQDLLRHCLQSVLSSQLHNATLEIIVVDNASRDGSPDMVRHEFPHVTLLSNSNNLGFAKANNQAISHSQGRYLLLLNSDTLVPPETLWGLIQFMEQNSRVGACSPRLLTTTGSPQTFAFGEDPTLIYLLRRGLNQLLFHRYLHDWAITQPQAVDWVSGACLMVRREVVTQIGGLDEQIFMYFEDNDWCLRIRQAGWQIYYYPQVAITHLGGQSLIKNPKAQQAYYQSLSYFYHKHYSKVAQFILQGLLLLYKWIHHALRS